MIEDNARFILKLRQNISLEGDLKLAQMELEALLGPGVKAVDEIESELRNIVGLPNFNGLLAPGAHVRKNGTHGYVAQAALSVLPNLVRRLSFIQCIYLFTKDTPRTRRILEDFADDLGTVVLLKSAAQELVAYAIPHYTIFELSDIIARRAESPKDAQRKMNNVLSALLGQESGQEALALAEAALTQRSTTSHLFHGLHYYKAKFFPRMARAVLNICATKLGPGTHRVLDNFVGSGTTLIEATMLGIPSVGVDIDPLSVLISRAKLQLLRTDSKLLAVETERLRQALDSIKSGSATLWEEPNRPLGPDVDLTFPDWLMKNKKMNEQMARELQSEIRLLLKVVAEASEEFRDIFRVIVSDAICRRVRFRFLGTGVGRFSLTFSKTSMLCHFLKSIQHIAKSAAVIEWLKNRFNLMLAPAEVIQGDAKHLPPEVGTCDILLTSPPYLPASSGRESYTQSRALSLLALGLQTHKGLNDLIDEAIGSMKSDSVDKNKLSEDERALVEWISNDKLRHIKALPTARYFLDIRQAFSEMRRVLLPGALAVVVIGKQSTFYEFASRRALYVVPSAQLLATEAAGVGFEIWGLYDLQLQKANKNARPRSLDDYFETLIMLRVPSKSD